METTGCCRSKETVMMVYATTYHVAMVVHVQDDILAHDGQTDQRDVCSVSGQDGCVYYGLSGLRQIISIHQRSFGL